MRIDNVQVGDLQPGDTVLRMPDDSPMYEVVQVDPVDSGEVRGTVKYTTGLVGFKFWKTPEVKVVVDRLAE